VADLEERVSTLSLRGSAIAVSIVRYVILRSMKHCACTTNDPVNLYT